MTTKLSRKVQAKRGCQDPGGEYLFSNILIFSWNLVFYHWQWILSAVSLEMTSSFPWFPRKCLANKYQVVKTIVFLLVVFQVKTVLQKKLLVTAQSHKCFSWDNHCAWRWGQRAGCVFPISSARMFKRHVLVSWDLITFDNFYCFIKIIHKRDWLLFFFSVHAWLLRYTTASICPKMPANFTHKTATPGKNDDFENSCDLSATPAKDLMDPGVHEQHLRSVGIRYPMNRPGT